VGTEGPDAGRAAQGSAFEGTEVGHVARAVRSEWAPARPFHKTSSSLVVRGMRCWWSSLTVHRRSTAMARLDSLLEILGPGWIDALGTRMTQTTFKFLANYADSHQVRRLGAARLARWFQHHSRKAWGPERAGAIIAAAEATLAIWGNDGLDFEALAADIAAEALIALEVSEQIALLDRRIQDLYLEADPDGIVRSAPGVGDILAGQILGRLGDPARFASLAAARSFSGLIPIRRTGAAATAAV
jgi:Transposase IS116/IS110/IS902 family